MTDPEDNLTDSIRTAVIKTCNTWDIPLRDHDDIRITQTSDDTYEVTLPITGRVVLDEVLDDQGTLLYMKKDVEIHITGFLDDRLVFGVTLH